MIRRSSFIAAAVLCAGCAAPTIARLSSNAPSEIFILAGQSNMSGRGELSQDIPSELKPDPAILLYGNDGRWRIAAEPIDSALNQIDAVSIDTNAGVGPGLAFAKLLRTSQSHRKFILVPCARGGTSVTQWKPDTSRSTLYGSCLARAREASKLGRIAGLIWYQGESDAKSAETAQAWAARFGDLIAAFRTDLSTPNLPVLMVGIADPPKVGRFAGQFPAWSEVQQAQANLRLTQVFYVSAAGLEKLEDDLHLSTRGQMTLAQRMAKAWSERP